MKAAALTGDVDEMEMWLERMQETVPEEGSKERNGHYVDGRFDMI